MQIKHELSGSASIDELAAFVAVVQFSSFKGAGKALGKDSTVISRRVGQLETHLGVRLLVRNTRNVALTEVGQTYFTRVAELLRSLNDASDEARNFTSTPQGSLRVSLPVTFGKQSVAPLLPTILKKYPRLKIDSFFTDRYVDLVSESIDVAVRIGSLDDSSLVARKIASYRSILVASPAYLAEHGLPGCPEDLCDHACLGFSNHASWPDWVLTNDEERRAIRPQGPLVSDSSEVLSMAAVAGAGIILGPTWLFAKEMQSGELVRVLPEWRSAGDGGIYAILPPGRLVPAKSRVFVDELVEALSCDWM